MWREALLVIALGQAALSHDFWLKPQGQKAALCYGHAQEDSDYDKGNLKKVTALNSKGEPVKVSEGLEGRHITFAPGPEAVQLAVEMDTGFWVKTTEGWKNESKRTASNALLSEWSLYYSKILFNPQACLNKRIGQPLELVPVAIEGESLKVRLLLRGKPLPEVKLYDEHKKVGDTDEAGEALVPYRGELVLSASYREPLVNHPDADRLNLHAVVTLPDSKK